MIVRPAGTRWSTTSSCGELALEQVRCTRYQHRVAVSPAVPTDARQPSGMPLAALARRVGSPLTSDVPRVRTSNLSLGQRLAWIKQRIGPHGRHLA